MAAANENFQGLCETALPPWGESVSFHRGANEHRTKNLPEGEGVWWAPQPEQPASRALTGWPTAQPLITCVPSKEASVRLHFHGARG